MTSWRIEGGRSTEELVTEEAESSTVHRREAAKGATRSGVWVRAGPRQSLGGFPGPTGMEEDRQETLGVLCSQCRL